MADDGDDGPEHTWVRVRGEQKMFLEAEALRLRRERFARSRDLGRVTMAETLAALLEELQRLREIVPDQDAPDVGVPADGRVTATAPEGNGAGPPDPGPGPAGE